MKGCPYDNAVAAATFKVIKTEFVKSQTFDSLIELKYELANYVNWFNYHRIHSSLGYLTPYEYRVNNLRKVCHYTFSPYLLNYSLKFSFIKDKELYESVPKESNPFDCSFIRFLR
jgi:hypothetical protein